MAKQLESQVAQSSTVARLEFAGSAFSGALTWTWSIYPEGINPTTTTATLVSGMTYDVTLPEDAFIYLRVQDSLGTYGGFPIEVLAEADPKMLMTGEVLRDRIISNLPELEFMIREHLPTDHREIRVVGYKMELDEPNPPWIVISRGKKTPSPAGISNLMNNTYQFTIALCVTVSDDPEDRTPAATALMDGLATVLNRAFYRSMTLPTGCTLGDCRATQGSAETVQTSVTSGYRFFSMGTVTWQGQLWVVEA